ncbi:hypothetical protein LMB58_06585 [Limosilactobacillus reuteri]|uniref:hypothetical protein n=1 Tax=Limosilactobacillus reuteri TaxID=1598 RepID=UPI001E2A09CE|nr:hypothetical protein [Limosilactobacillus reuteri]MCC4328182.1 hypothetical protein [Limosilactobacillus reuteri]MCC4336448.1 hypothetical protein [Limosilactobacillus reuteri]MCC4338222.1 hypothetical protein [Limosilactobacillus reuteri]
MKNSKETWYYIVIGILIIAYILVSIWVFFGSKVAFEKRLSMLMTMISSSLSILISILVASLAAIRQLRTYEKQKKIDKQNKWKNMKLLVELELDSDKRRLSKFINKDYTSKEVLQYMLSVKLWENSIEYIAYGEKSAKELFETYQKLNAIKTMDPKGISDNIVQNTLDQVSNTLKLIRESNK